MKILLVHNHYQQAGGEDQVFADEATLLADHGHEVLRYTLHNDAIQSMNGMVAATHTVWNTNVYRELRQLFVRERPALMHCTNTFPLISPAAYYAAHAEGVPVVQSLHNYRLICPNAQFLRDGRVCEDCLGKQLATPAIRHSCYRGNRAATTVLAGMLTAHRLLGTWQRKVDRYIVLTEFAREKFIKAGFPADRLVVKPNFVAPDSGPGEGSGGYALFVGRLSNEKGIETLLDAWHSDASLPPLKIVGDGPLRDRVIAATQQTPSMEWLGPRPNEEVQRILSQAAMLVFPSIWYEGLPKTIVEAFCQGTPVIASKLGAMIELIDEGSTGILFRPGDSTDLARAAKDAWRQTDRLAEMRRNARAEFERKYTADANYRRLTSIYEDILDCRNENLAEPPLALASRAAESYPECAVANR